MGFTNSAGFTNGRSFREARRRSESGLPVLGGQSGAFTVAMPSVLVIGRMPASKTAPRTGWMS